MLYRICLLSFCFGLCSCAVPKTSNTSSATIPVSTPEEREANRGALPTDYQEQIKNHWTQKLIDPTGPIYYFEQPSVSTTGESWQVLHWVNGKNSFGGYSGKRWANAYFIDGKLVRVEGDERRNVQESLQQEIDMINQRLGR